MRPALALAALVLALPGAAEADRGSWAADLHAAAMAMAPQYARVGRTKVLAGCVRWPGSDAGSPELLFQANRATTGAANAPVPTGRLRRNALQACQGEAAGRDCTCIVIDENGRNAVRLPGE